MTRYRWFAIALDQLPTDLLPHPPGDAGNEVRAWLTRPVAGQDAPVRLLGTDPVSAPIVVLVDGWPTSPDSPTLAGKGLERREQDRRAARPQYAVVLKAEEHWAAADSELEPPGDWDKGTLKFPGCDSGSALKAAPAIVQKWVAALVVAQHWAFSDVAAQLAKLDRDDGSGVEAASVYETFRQRKNRLWWLRASDNADLQAAYAGLQSDYGCIDLHDQMLQETGLWQDHVSRRQTSLQNSLLLLLTFAAGALGATSIVATVASGADLLTGATASIFFFLLLVAVFWRAAPVQQSYRAVRGGPW